MVVRTLDNKSSRTQRVGGQSVDTASNAYGGPVSIVNGNRNVHSPYNQVDSYPDYGSPVVQGKAGAGLVSSHSTRLLP